jgi:hypothetical protein
MEPGDVVSYDGERWKVLSRDREFRICVLSNWEGRQVEVADDLDKRSGSGLALIHQPSAWPFVAVKGTVKGGRILNVYRGGRLLRPLEDWVPTSIFGTGGSLFFNPALGLRLGEVLTVERERGSVSRISITRSFGTAGHKKRRAEKPWKPRQRATAIDRLMGEDDPFGES